MTDFREYQDAKQNILEYINDRDTFNRVYYLINENMDILNKIVNTTYKNFDMVDKSLVLSFIEHLKEVMDVNVNHVRTETPRRHVPDTNA